MNLYYAGIGSRRTPTEVLELMTKIAKRLADLGYTLRSGGADGADTAFEKGADKKEIFLPWQNFNGNPSPLFHIPDEAFELAKQFHPNWDACSYGARKLHARNCQQVLGKDLDSPIAFVVCWHDGSGGTTQACRIASHYNIPIVNLADDDWKTKLAALVADNK